MVDWTDSEVVAACRRGRPEGFAQLLLRYQAEDIARHLDLPLGTVKTYLFRARRALRESLAASWEG